MQQLIMRCGWIYAQQMITHYTVQAEESKVTIQITKTAGADKSINVYLFVLQDAQINFEDGRFKEVNY